MKDQFILMETEQQGQEKAQSVSLLNLGADKYYCIETLRICTTVLDYYSTSPQALSYVVRRLNAAIFRTSIPLLNRLPEILLQELESAFSNFGLVASLVTGSSILHG